MRARHRAPSLSRRRRRTRALRDAAARVGPAKTSASQRRAERRGRGGEGQEDVTALIAFLLLVVMFVIGSLVHGARSSFWKLLAFVAACVVVLVLLYAILAK
jgi:Ca2+/Na+ antiporter